MRSNYYWGLLATAFFVVAALPGQERVLLKDATVLTVSSGTIAGGDILLEGGKITAIGESLDAPDGTKVVDLAGHFVTPGIIDCHSHMAADSINEGAIPVSSMVGIEDVLDPTDQTIYRALAGGVTTANVLHGSANPIGGKCQVIKMRWGKDAEGLKFEGSLPGIKFALGENPKRSNSTRYTPAHPSSRMGVIDVIRHAFHRARDYRRTWREYDRERMGGTAGLIRPRRDLELEPLVEILDGERLVHAHCYRADEIIALLRVAEEFGFRIRTLQHVLEGYKVANEIAAHGAGASTFSDWWGYKVEAYDAIPHNAALMTRRGILVSINSDSGEEVRHLNQEAAKAMKWGDLNEAEALALVTLNPAKQLLIDGRVGSIEVGKDADLAVWDAHPLSVYAKAVKTYVDGELYFDRERDLVEREERAAERERLFAAEKAAAKKGKKKSAKEETAEVMR